MLPAYFSATILLMKARKKLVVGNWKMNPKSVGEAVKLYAGVRKTASKLKNINVGIAAPFPYLAGLKRLSAGRGGVELAAQDVFWEKKGPYTGEVSISILESVGVTRVIVGHSERRTLGETDETINKKLRAITRSSLTAILCVGERERDHGGKHFGFVESQIKSAFNQIPRTKLDHIVVAYEPVWALSTSKEGHAATPEDAHEMIIFVRKILSELYNRPAAENMYVLYGGSVNTKNVENFLMWSSADGFLIGGASLKINDFSSILKSTHDCKTR